MSRLPKIFLTVLVLSLLLGLVMPALAAETTGKIKSIQPDKNEFVFTDANNKEFTFHLERDAKIKINDTVSKFSDLRVGDEVTVTYDRNDGRLMASVITCKRKNQ